MLDILLTAAGVVYLLVIALLFVYGVNFFYLTVLALRRRADPPPPSLDRWPKVTVQLPIYNELYVAERLLRSAAALDYPRDRLEIQVLDDSTDETAALVEQWVRQLREQGVNICHLHRANRQGFKAGALAAGLEAASGEFLAIFDADFVPHPDFLRKTLPHFHDPWVGFVQTRWEHLNREDSLLTRLQALAIDAHFMVEQSARSLGGFWFNFNGTAGVWRKEAIYASGGWRADTLTEDLDLSYRCFLHGWRAVYLRDVSVPAELPASFNAYRRQQQRWARGSLECALRLIPQVWRAPISFTSRVQSTLHLTGYFVHLLLFALTLLYLPVWMLAQRHPQLVSLFGLAILFNLTALAPTGMFLAAQRLKTRRWLGQVPAILFLTVLGCGMMLNTARAAFEVLRNRPGSFERTPKYGFQPRHQRWTDRTKYHLRVDGIVFLELLLAGWSGAVAWLALHSSSWAIALYSALFCGGLLYVSGMSLLQTLAIHRHAAELAHPGERP
jgi:cellulose synthase/poly-beta-1,6-N-acetylglucosamine synthase-like glycosyltransferase